jgi:hypothetical protein
MSSTTIDATHPILGLVRRLHAGLDEVTESQPVFMSVEDKATALVQIARAETRLAEARLRIMATADDVAATNASRDVATWLAHRTRSEPRAMRADLELAKKLDTRYGGVAAGMAAGDVTLAQAHAITTALDDLAEADAVGPDLVGQAETTLVGYAGQFRPHQLRRLGRHILDVIAPEIAEEEEARKLAEQEREARKKARLHFRPLGDGTTRISGRLPDPVAVRLKTYLDAYTSPRHRDPHHRDAHQPGTGTGAAAAGHRDGHGRPQDPGPFGTREGDRIPQARKYAQAFAALLEHLDPDRLPEHGGDATTILVTISLDQLRTELATAGLLDDTTTDHSGGTGGTAGANLTAAEARRLACTAQLIPLVLGGESEVLDQGRSRRLFTPAQRKAMRYRDRTCRAEHCDHPAAWCEAHHLTAWSKGGRTDTAMLCPHHHHRIHDPTYQADRLPNGDIRFHRRT